MRFKPLDKPARRSIDMTDHAHTRPFNADETTRGPSTDVAKVADKLPHRINRGIEFFLNVNPLHVVPLGDVPAGLRPNVTLSGRGEHREPRSVEA
jgi:hypothetical protein